MHPHFNRLFRGQMSLRRRSHGPANVIPHVWRCHCGPERGHSKSVHCLRPVGGRFAPVSATKSRLWPLCCKTQTPVHPRYCVEGAEKKRAYSTPHSCATLQGSGPIRARIPAQPYERSYSALRLCTLSCENSAPKSRGRPQGGGRVGAETIDQSPGDGTLRRAAGGSAAWAADPRPGVHIWAGDIHAPPHGRFRAAISPFTLEGGRRNTTAPTTARLASGTTTGSGMRRANGRNPSRDLRATAYTAEQQETLRRGLRILARIIARSHLRRQESRSTAAPRPPTEGEDGD